MPKAGSTQKNTRKNEPSVIQPKNALSLTTLNRASMYSRTALGSLPGPVYAFWMGGDVPIVYDPHTASNRIIRNIFKGNVELAESQLRRLLSSSTFVSEPRLAPNPRIDARHVVIDFVYDAFSGEILLGCTTAAVGLRLHLLCFSDRLGNFIIHHIDRRRQDGVRYVFIQCLEDTLQFNYHSFQRIVIANEHLEEFLELDPDSLERPHPERWKKVLSKHDNELNTLLTEKRVKFT